MGAPRTRFEVVFEECAGVDQPWTAVGLVTTVAVASNVAARVGLRYSGGLTAGPSRLCCALAGLATDTNPPHVVTPPETGTGFSLRRLPPGYL